MNKFLSHHLTDETLQDYSAGVLSSPMETLIACHLTLCPECRARASMADDIGGAVLGGQASAPMVGTAKDILAMHESMADYHDPESGLQGFDSAEKSGVPRPLARMLPSNLNELPWKTFAPGMRQYNIGKGPRKDGAFKLLSLDPGSRMSKHSHQHRELTFIISGSYSDEMGQFRAGDISDLSGEHSHTPHVDSDIPCVSLIATDAPVKFEGLFGKIVQPFVGI